jgi:hypothetical protein
MVLHSFYQQADKARHVTNKGSFATLFEKKQAPVHFMLFNEKET